MFTPKENPGDFDKISPSTSKAGSRWKAMVINCLQFILVLKVQLVLTQGGPEIINSVERRGEVAPRSQGRGIRLSPCYDGWQQPSAPNSSQRIHLWFKPKSHTWGENRQKPRQETPSAKLESLEKWRRQKPPRSLPYKSPSDVFSSPSWLFLSVSLIGH